MPDEARAVEVRYYRPGDIVLVRNSTWLSRVISWTLGVCDGA